MFLAPLWLALGAVAAVPVLLHLLRRRSGARIEFPAVRFLIRAEKEHRRQMRMRNLLLMVLRVAIVLAVALAAARPLGPAGGSGHAPTAIAIVLDNSMSAGAVRNGRATIDVLREAAARILDDAMPDDLIWLITVDGEVSATGAGAAREALTRVQPIDGAGRLVSALERGASLARASGYSARTVVVLTDGQATAWQRAVQTGGVPVTVLLLDEPPIPNRSLRDAAAEPLRWAPRGAVSVAVQSDDSADVRVALGDRTLARTMAGPNATLTVRGTAGRDGWLAGLAELPPDELRSDDARHFAIFAGDAPLVRVDASSGDFVRTAFDALADGARVRLGGGIAVAGAESGARRPMLAFAPDDPVRAGAANRALAAAGVPWRFGDVVRDETSVRDGDLDGTVVRMRYPLIATGNATVDTLATAGGGPWVVAGDQYVLVGSPMNPSATDLPVSARFLPWVEGVLTRHLLTDGGRIVHAAPLDEIVVPVGVDELLSTGGEARAVRGRSVAAPTVAGVYWMRRAGAVVGALVVNPEPFESDLAVLDSAGVAARFADQSPTVSTVRENVAAAAFATEARRPLVFVLLALLAALLLAETLMARQPRRGEA